MRITFWGTRGSLPAPLDTNEFKVKVKRLLHNAKGVDLNDDAAIDTYLDECPMPDSMTFGGNTPCVEITDGDHQVILDCGSGLRELGRDMMKRGFKPGGRIDILQTHTHWDHIMGFPFFAPAYTNGTEIHIHGLHPNLSDRFEQQMDLIHFPITMNEMKSSITFHQLAHDEEYELGPFKITNKALHHPGGSYSYRIESGDKSVVFATDGEYINLNEEFETYIDFYRDSDVLIFDAMYATLEKTIERENFGHSTPVIGINIALTSNVKNLFLFHHDPESNDKHVYDAYDQAGKFLESEKRHFPESTLKLMIAYDTLSFDL
ncbi:MBL fold metallo-hydrolase [Candidatus Latescibacterota bacterium]